MRRLCAVATAALLTGASFAPAAMAWAQTSAPGARALNVQGADIRAFINDVARSTGKTFIVDPAVSGTVSVTSERPLSRSDLFQVFLSTLRANGLVVVPMASGAYRITPAEGAAQNPAAVGGEAFRTEVFQLRALDAASAAETLRPLVGTQGQVIPSPSGNTLVVADFADNLARIRALIARIDVDRSSMSVIALENSSARELAQVIAQVIAPPGGSGPALVSVTPVDSSNALVVRGDPEVVARVESLAHDLDARARSADDIRVVFLEHANAEQLLPVLQQLLGQGGGPATAVSATSGPATAGAAATAAAPIGASGPRGAIARFPGANALVISGPADTQRMIGEVIRQLDIRRQQVLIEAIVVELSDTAVHELGVQWLVADRDGRTLAATTYSGSSAPLLPLAGAAAANGLSDSDPLKKALQQAAVNSLIGANGFIGGSLHKLGEDGLLGFVINAAKSDAGSNLLQTPSLMTLDNEEATILVGQEVPITTGEAVLSGSANPFRTTERQNIGVKLVIKPQINAGGSITLELRQEVSSINRALTAGASDLVLNKRELETTLVLDDGAIAVAGGLLDQTDQMSVDAVPGLGQLPGVGRLFRSTRRQGGKTNLMIFIRPTIVRTANDAQTLAADRWGYMRGRQAEALPGQEPSLDEMLREYMRTQPPAAPTMALAPVEPVATSDLPPVETAQAPP